MRIPAIKYSQYLPTSKNNNDKHFGGNFSAQKKPVIDNILRRKFVQNLFKIANKNPHVFNLINLAVFGMALKPATVLVIPGAEKEDKQYVAAKSLIGTSLMVASQLLISIPLGKSIEKLGKAAEKNPKIRFPKFNSPKFDAYNFLISNAVGLILTLALSSFLTVKLTTKIMNKLLPQKDSKANDYTQKPQGKERGSL